MWDYRSIWDVLCVQLSKKSVHKLLGKGIVLAALAVSFQSKAQIQFTDTTSAAGPFHTGESWGASWGAFE